MSVKSAILGMSQSIWLRFDYIDKSVKCIKEIELC